MKAARNRTLDITAEEGAEYLARCLRPTGPLSLPEVLDRTLCGDSFDILPLLPRGFADLLIVDPPYNLTKDFHGSRFSRTSDKEYEAYTQRWLSLCLPLLKPDASVYVCCDWRSSLVIGRVLADKLTVRNRITWQREKGRGAKANWKNAMEDIWFATVSEDYCFHADAVRQRRRVIAPYRENGAPKDWEETADGRFRDTAPSNFWDDISIPYWSMPENTAHLGSGSSAVTARKLGRHFVGVEQNEQYCAWAEKRLALAAAEPAIQGYADGVFWERNTFALQKKRR